MVNRLCSIFECHRPHQYKVWYVAKVGKCVSTNHTKVCREHALHFPWGRVTKQQKL